MLSIHFTVLILCMAAISVSAISQLIRIYERKPDMYKYDMPLAIMNEYAGLLRLQQEKNAAYGAMLQALSNDYRTVYFINADTEEYIKYIIHDECGLLWLDKHRRYFFTELYRELIRRVDKNDLQKLEDALKKENILKMLDDKGVFTVKFRTIRGGMTQYNILKAVYFMKKDSNHIVIGIKNITDNIQDQNEYKEAVGQAIHLAVIDDLTGVKNRNAYVKHEQDIDNALEEDKDTNFAIIVLDINNLKQVNDTQGHKAGDSLLREASSLIREVFDGNEIYRIGGDEFAVILTGDACKERTELINKFRARVAENICKGGVVVASGLAEYMSDVDENAEAVFDRADAAMYKNKNDLKNNAV
ncbi:MAG: GGDEF domain-containing protein [Clostridia bacterium]|nr:GGDEF domain-containing protein [Clostridia bacterium]